jgi:hypothetical protein
VSVPRARLEELVTALSEASEGAGRVNRLVADLQLFARAEDRSRTAVELDTVAQCAIKLATPQTRNRARVVTDFDDTPQVKAEEPRLVQLVLNLIVNAAQATSADGGRLGLPRGILNRGSEPVQRASRSVSISISSDTRIGLGRNSASNRIASRTSSSGSRVAVMKTNGTFDFFCSRRVRRNAAPFIPGNVKSQTTASNDPRSFSSASSQLRAVST